MQERADLLQRRERVIGFDGKDDRVTIFNVIEGETRNDPDVRDLKGKAALWRFYDELSSV